MNKLDVYYNHYRDTDTISKTAQLHRNKSFVLLCFLEAISFLLIINPNLICSLLNDVARKELESTVQFSNAVLQTLVWILIVYVLVRYVQDVLFIERQYRYLGILEKKISDLLGEGMDNLFSREGDRYLDNYPIVLNLIDLFYKFFSPILFTVLNTAHIIKEWEYCMSIAALVVDIAIYIVIFIITWFYFFEIHSKIARWFKKCPPVGWMANLLRKWLKEV